MKRKKSILAEEFVLLDLEQRLMAIMECAVAVGFPFCDEPSWKKHLSMIGSQSA